MLTVATFKWKPTLHTYRSKFGPETVNVLRRMVARHYTQPHRFVCITDDAKGLDPDVQVVPLWSDFAHVPSPYGHHQPSCYRRLKVFSPAIEQMLGPRFVCLDLDTVIVRDMAPVWDRPEDFVIWGETDPRSFYNGSMFLMTAGARKQVLENFDPERSPQYAKAAGRFGSDQGFISYVLGPGETKWTTADGVYSFRVHLKNGELPLPDNARIVMWHGGIDPWSAQGQRLEWVRRHYV